MAPIAVVEWTNKSLSDWLIGAGLVAMETAAFSHWLRH